MSEIGILLEDVTKKYGDSIILDCINLEVRKGSIVALCGGSGAGKSTLLGILLGTTLPDSGIVEFDGRSIFEEPKVSVGALFQNNALFSGMDVSTNIAMGLGLFNKSIVGGLSKEMRKKIKDSMSEFLLEDSVALMYSDQLSGGMARRVALMRALIGNPNVVIADEPTSGLDLVSSKAVAEIFQAYRKRNAKSSTLIVTHDTDFATSVADTLVVLRDGRIVCLGSAANCTKELLAKYLY